MNARASAEAFNPWTATALEASQATPIPGAPEPLAQWQAAQDVTQARESCTGEAGGVAVMQCLADCLAARLDAPQWLADAYLKRHSLVTDAEVATFDEAFGRVWPPHTRLDRVREARRVRDLIHAAAWDLASSEPDVPINRIFFDRIGEMRGINKSGSACEAHYYEALRLGSPSVSLFRRSKSQ